VSLHKNQNIIVDFVKHQQIVFWESFGSTQYSTHNLHGKPLLSFKLNLLFAIGSKELFRILMLLLNLPSRDTLMSNTTAKKKNWQNK
jgi:hypothetical protein